jgi:hypothetical protein
MVGRWEKAEDGTNYESAPGPLLSMEELERLLRPRSAG